MLHFAGRKIHFVMNPDRSAADAHYYHKAGLKKASRQCSPQERQHPETLVQSVMRWKCMVKFQKGINLFVKQDNEI